MQTQSEQMRSTESGARDQSWAPATDKPRRSVFSNFKAKPVEAPESSRTKLEQAKRDPDEGAGAAKQKFAGQSLQARIDVAVARAFLYQYLARAFDDPCPETWSWLTDSKTEAAL